MNKYQYKEKDYANEIVHNGFTSNYIVSELKILAKYYKEQALDEPTIKQKLKEFCKKHMVGYNEAIHFKIINSAVTNSLKEQNKLIQIDQIGVTESEIERIEEMNIDHEYKRVVFSLLVLTKLSKEYIRLKDGEIKSKEYYFGGHKNYRELVSVSKTTFKKNKKSSVKSIHELIRMLDEMGIVKITGNGNIKLLFMYDIPHTDKIAIHISQYDSIGYYLDRYFSLNNVKSCKECKNPIKPSSRNQIYCQECKRKIKTLKTQLRVKKHRDRTM